MEADRAERRRQEKEAARENEKAAKKHGAEPQFHCPFPNCGRLFWKEPGLPDVCPYHRGLIEDVQFILAHLKPPPDEPAGTKILVPKPGMAEAAIRQARQEAGRGP